MSSNGVTLSVVVLTCNQWAVTARLLRSMVPWLSECPDTELVLVDNGSSDGSEEGLSMTGGLEKEGRFKFFRNPRNLGVAAGRNAGIARTRGEFVLILDNDTVFSPGAVEGLLRHIRFNPQCGVCAPALVSPEGELQASAKPFPGLGLKLRHFLQRGESEAERAELRNPHPFYVIGACQLVRRRALEAAGPLDEGIFYGPEDADFCMRVRKYGFTVDYLPQFRLVHDWRRATRRSPFSRLAFLHMKGLLHFYAKHRRWLR